MLQNQLLKKIGDLQEDLKAASEGLEFKEEWSAPPQLLDLFEEYEEKNVLLIDPIAKRRKELMSKFDVMYNFVEVSSTKEALDRVSDIKNLSLVMVTEDLKDESPYDFVEKFNKTKSKYLTKFIPIMLITEKNYTPADAWEYDMDEVVYRNNKKLVRRTTELIRLWKRINFLTDTYPKPIKMMI